MTQTHARFPVTLRRLRRAFAKLGYQAQAPTGLRTDDRGRKRFHELLRQLEVVDQRETFLFALETQPSEQGRPLAWRLWAQQPTRRSYRSACHRRQTPRYARAERGRFQPRCKPTPPTPTAQALVGTEEVEVEFAA